MEKPVKEFTIIECKNCGHNEISITSVETNLLVGLVEIKTFCDICNFGHTLCFVKADLQTGYVWHLTE